ncbi:MAG TPA: hypothetical protein VMX16_07200 [Terriglobia bacterium]|nr:hypothetical protein [Terriglobia bacterium]
MSREPRSDIFHTHTPVGKKLVVPDFASREVQKETDEEPIEITTKGKNIMPGFEKTLGNTQFKELVAYVRDLAPKK